MVEQYKSDDLWPFPVDILILGAGFSHAVTNGSMPLMKDFFHKLNITQYPHLYKALECLGNKLDTNVEDLLLILNQLENSPDNIRHDCAKEMTSHCILTAKNELEKYCIERLCKPGDIHGNWAYLLLR